MLWIIAMALLVLSWRKWKDVEVENYELRKFNVQQITKKLEAEFDRMMLSMGFKRRDSELWPEEINE